MGDGTTEQDRPLHIFTLNVNGLKKKKSRELLNVLESREVDVVFLTETHIGEDDTLTGFEDWRPFFSCNNSSSKGVAILVKNERDFRILDEIVDQSGCYVILSCWISGRFCTFVSVYHHGEEKGLLKELSEKIKPLYTDILVVGGDFNTALDKDKDTKSKKDNDDHIRIRKKLLPFMDEHDLRDAWREKHPDEEQYTYKEGTIETSRLDYFFINADKLGLVKDCRNNDYISDHRSVSLFLDLKDQTRELKILSCTVHNLPGDEDLAKLRPDIILLAKREVKDEDCITKLKEREKKWNMLCSDDRNAAILVAEGQRGIHVLFTVHKEDYVILHCIVLGRLHTFVSVCHLKGTHKNLQDMLQDIKPSYSGIKVIGGIFNISKQNNKDFIEEYRFKKLEGQLPCLIHAQFSQDYEIKNQKIDENKLYFSLCFPKMNSKDVDRIIQSLGQLKIHRCFSAATKK